jgi:hypothetical protein
MAWYAKIENNIVIDVLYLVDTKDSEWLYREYGGTWLRCAEDGSIRQFFPAAGFTYDSQRDAFLPPKPFASWIFDEATCCWISPVPMPTDDMRYTWNEETQSWIGV